MKASAQALVLHSGMTKASANVRGTWHLPPYPWLGSLLRLSSRTAIFAGYRYFKSFEQSEAAWNGDGKMGSYAGLIYVYALADLFSNPPTALNILSAINL